MSLVLPKFWECVIPKSEQFTMLSDRISFMLSPKVLTEIYLPRGHLLAIDLNPDTGYCEMGVFRDEDAEFIGEKKGFHPETYSRFHSIADQYCREVIKASKKPNCSID